MGTPEYYAELKEVSKVYHERFANKNVNLRIQRGEIHGLIGENGAGKSTAMKILFGLIPATSGDVLIGGKPQTHWSARQAFDCKIGMVQQHFMLAPHETVLDNLVLGVEKTSVLGFRNRSEEIKSIQTLMKESGIQVNLEKKVKDLSLGDQSRCEILKVLYRKAEFLIFDEPTAVLTPQETDNFLESLKKLKRQGKTILIVTHKLREIMDVCDSVTVMRHGEVVAEKSIAHTSVPELTELMIGRKPEFPQVESFAISPEEKRANLLEIPGFEIEIPGGEILGIAGIEGNGQNEIVDEFLRIPKELRALPVGVIPPDRHKDSLALSMSLEENLQLGRAQNKRKSFSFFKPHKDTLEFLKDNDIRPAQPSALAGGLSGGNQQKLIVARELAYVEPLPRRILICHPTRGVDIGAIEHIHKKILKMAKDGSSVLLISSELEELMRLSHKIAVVFQGKIIQYFPPPYDERKIGETMLTGKASP